MANVGSGDVGKTLIGNGNGQGPTYASIGTNSGLTAHGVIIGQNNGAFIATAAGTAGQVFTSGGASADPTFQTPLVPLWYGDGFNGPVTFDGTTTVLGIAPSGNTYILTKDLVISSSTINNGVTIFTGGFRLYCNGTLTNNGTIQFNGNPGTVGGNGGSAFSTPSSFAANGAGGNGSTGTGGAGSSKTTALGGNGGAGGAGVSGAGAIGTATAPVAGLPVHVFSALTTGISSAPVAFAGGGGGSAGGGDGVAKGGGGGAGGGGILLCAYLIAGTGSIQALGGNGGAGAVGATNAGGGGGGGGGFVMIVSLSAAGNAVAGQTISVAGGSPGAGTGLGATGSSGSSGTIIAVAG